MFGSNIDWLKDMLNIHDCLSSFTAGFKNDFFVPVDKLVKSLNSRGQHSTRQCESVILWTLNRDSVIVLCVRNVNRETDCRWSY